MTIKKGVEKTEYSWNPNFSSVPDAPIEQVIEELRTIEESYGQILPEYIIESSKNKKSLLHSYFEWDNESAAHKWRLRQASNLLRHIEVTVVGKGEVKTMRAFEVTTKRWASVNGTPAYNAIDTSDPQSIAAAKSLSVGDLHRVIKRLETYGIKEPIPLLQQALQVLVGNIVEDKPAEASRVSAKRGLERIGSVRPN